MGGTCGRARTETDSQRAVLESFIRARRILAILISCSLPVAGARAQRMAGSVFFPDSTTPAAGMLVVAIGPGGATVARALSGSGGEFELALPRAGTFGVQVLRIGYRPTLVAPFDVAAGEVHRLRVVLDGKAVTLAKVTVRGENVCRIARDSGQLVARVWEEARKALASSQLDAGGTPLDAEWVKYDRVFDPRGTVVRSQTVSAIHSQTKHAFVSLSPDSLAQSGYVVSDETGTTFYAPDAEALLSDQFVSGHCFRVEPAPPDRGDLIGVHFRPARAQRGFKDIDGTLWLDRASAELRWLEYHYTGLDDAATEAGAGGRVEFLRLTTGSWLVSRWWIRMPRVEAAPRRDEGGFRERIGSAPPVVRAIHVVGGEVTGVRQGATTLYRARGSALVIQLTAADTSTALANATVSLTGTGYDARVDARGRARIAPVLAGHYRVRALTVEMAEVGVPAVEREVEVREGAEIVDSLALPSANDMLRAACGDSVVKAAQAQLRGAVHDSVGHPLAGVDVTASWKSFLLAHDASTEARVVATTHAVDVATDGVGRWRLCGVPREAPVAVQVVTPGDSGATIVRLGAEQEFGVADLRTRPRRAALARAAVVPGSGRGTVEVSVSESGGTPLADATIELVAGRDSARSAVTDTSGRVLFGGVAAGLARVRARRVGFRPGELEVRVAEGGNTVPVILDRSRMPVLDTVRVVGDRPVSTRLDEFETRRIRHEASASITREEIERRHPVDLAQVLMDVPSIKVIDSFGGTVIQSTRGLVTDNKGNPVPCNLRLMVDGVVVAEGTNINSIPVKDVYGIEVFAGPSRIPLQYGGIRRDAWCGLVAVWTRDGSHR